MMKVHIFKIWNSWYLRLFYINSNFDNVVKMINQCSAVNEWMSDNRPPIELSFFQENPNSMIVCQKSVNNILSRFWLVSWLHSFFWYVHMHWTPITFTKVLQSIINRSLIYNIFWRADKFIFSEKTNIWQNICKSCFCQHALEHTTAKPLTNVTSKSSKKNFMSRKKW